MGTIWNYVGINPSERPKFTSYELAKLVREQRESLNLSVEDIAAEHDVSPAFWNSIEKASRAFNFKIYDIIGSFLGMSDDELLSVEKDDLSRLSFRASDLEDQSIAKTVDLANAIFDEMVMQEKIGV